MRIIKKQKQVKQEQVKQVNVYMENAKRLSGKFFVVRQSPVGKADHEQQFRMLAINPGTCRSKLRSPVFWLGGEEARKASCRKGGLRSNCWADSLKRAGIQTKGRLSSKRN